jgi:putative sigma-54 modulation protein
VITAISSKEDLFDAVDDVRNKIYTQLEKTKGRYMNKRVKEEVVEMPIENTYDDYESLSNKYDVVKIKTRDVKPMLVEEAIEQMNLLKHDFFIYLDAETNVVNVIYRRKQGDYGLIETVISNKE